VHFLFIGDGAMKSTIMNQADQLALKNVTFLDPISKQDVPEYLSIVDVSLAPLKKEDNFKTVIPSKIFEAAAMKKPTLLGVEGQAQEILEKYGAGICFEPENEADFLQKIEILQSVEFYASCQDACENLANDFDRKKLAGKMLQMIKSLL
jgi:glycosyltransferase involved in cell wall biosynthesis